MLFEGVGGSLPHRRLVSPLQSLDLSLIANPDDIATMMVETSEHLLVHFHAFLWSQPSASNWSNGSSVTYGGLPVLDDHTPRMRHVPGLEVQSGWALDTSVT